MTPRDRNIETIITLRTAIQSNMSLRKIKFSSELPPCLKTIKHEELSFWEPFQVSLHDNELIFYENKIREDIAHNSSEYYK